MERRSHDGQVRLRLPLPLLHDPPSLFFHRLGLPLSAGAVCPAEAPPRLRCLCVCVCVCVRACSVRSPARAKPALSRVVTFSVHSYILIYSKLGLSLSLPFPLSLVFCCSRLATELFRVRAVPSTTRSKRVGVSSPSLPGPRPPWSRPSPRTRSRCYVRAWRNEAGPPGS